MDDDGAFACSLAEHLRRDGHDVTIAPTGIEALTSAQREAPDAVVLAVVLSDASGHHVASQLRSDVAPRAAIIVVAQAVPFDSAHDHLVDLHLTKPLDPELLPGLVRFVVGKRARPMR